MKGFKKWVTENWILFVIGCVLQGFAIQESYQVRGMLSYGGEWLIVPMILMTASIARGIAREIREQFFS